MENKQISLDLFVAYDLKYHKTRKTDYTNIHLELNLSNYVGREPKDLELLEKSITKLFLNAFDIDLKTCTEGEWTEKYPIKVEHLNNGRH
ncbi:MAG TPA: hypothetical protein VN456_18595 [Desulfosporosinus sp.]|nr:hypothetical protein [Desulfosporosinus sp.]